MDMSMRVWCTLMMVHVVRSATMHTGTRAASAEDSVHSDVLPWQAPQRDWHPSHVTDLKVMGMDRVRGALVGYNARTGKIISQRAREDRPSRIVYSEGILLSAKDCMALVRVDGEFKWRPPDGKRSQLWIARSNSGWANQITKFTMTNRNDGAFCECSVRPVNGVWQDTAMRRLDGPCVPWDEPKELPPGHVVRIPEHHERPEDDRDDECRLLTSELGSEDWFFAHHDQITETDCTRTKRQALASVAERPRIRGLTQLPRAPRARVMADLKHAARVLDSVDAPLAVLAVSLEMVAVTFRNSLRDRLNHLHNNSRLLPEERLALDADQDPDADVRFSYNRSCDGAADPLVQSALTSDGVAYTPETSNVTRLAMSYARHAEQHMTCMQEQMRAMGRAVECAANWLEAMPSTMGPVQATEADVDSALQEIRAGIQPAKVLQMHKEGKDADDLGDEIVRLVVTGAETMFRRTVSIFASYQSLVVAWRRYDGVEIESGLMEDIWCCFSGTLVADPRYPPCLMRAIRLVQREIQHDLDEYKRLEANRRW